MTESLPAASPAAAITRPGRVDADVHANVPNVFALFPYLPVYWHEHINQTLFKGPGESAYPRNAPTSARSGSKPEGGVAGSSLTLLQEQVLDPDGVERAILTCTYAIDSLRNPDAAIALARATNDWLREEWLKRELRLRGSIVVPSQLPAIAAEEIDRVAREPGFVQVLLPVRSMQPYGNRNYHPLWDAIARNNLVAALHFGGAPGNPPTPAGWPSTYLEEYAGMAEVFQSQLVSIVSEGVFDQFPSLRVVCLESGWTWLPPFFWRFDKEWRNLRRLVPWVRRAPSAYVREHVRFSIQPLDLPPDPVQLLQVFEQIGSDDTLLYASDYPHQHLFDPERDFLAHVPEKSAIKIRRTLRFPLSYRYRGGTAMLATYQRYAELARTRPALIDCDLHNELHHDVEALLPYLPARWREHVETYGVRSPAGGFYPRFMDHREDAKPPSGRRAGSDARWTGQHYLDPCNVAYGILIPLNPAPGQQNLELSAALAHACNDWQVAEWLDPEPRFRSSIAISVEDPEAAVAEIRERARDKRFVQVQFPGRPHEPMGRRKYWPIYEVCQEFALPVMSHAFGSYGQPITGTGWPSFYLEEHVGPAQAMQANLTSLVLDGAFERFPGLKVVSVENGFGWTPSLMWRLDASWKLLKNEVPNLKRLPSEYIRQQFYVTTQPMEEPNRPRYFPQLLEQMGELVNHLLFASDYPHWDADAPDESFPAPIPDDLRRKIYFDNAAQLYHLS